MIEFNDISGTTQMYTASDVDEQDLLLIPAATAAELTGNTNNYNPTGLHTSRYIRISSSGNIDITGLVAPSPAKYYIFVMVNIGSFTITLKHENVSSDANNRFLNPSGGNIRIRSNEPIRLLYDVVDSRWRPIGGEVV